LDDLIEINTIYILQYNLIYIKICYSKYLFFKILNIIKLKKLFFYFIYVEENILNDMK